MFAGAGGFEELRLVLIRVAANRDDVDVGIGEHFVEVIVSSDTAAVFGAQFVGIQRA